MYCMNCGKQISDDAIFCPYCGTKVRKGDMAGVNNSIPPEGQEKYGYRQGLPDRRQFNYSSGQNAADPNYHGPDAFGRQNGYGAGERHDSRFEQGRYTSQNLPRYQFHRQKQWNRSPKTKQRSKKKFIIAIIALAAVAVAGIGVFYYLRNLSSPEEKRWEAESEKGTDQLFFFQDIIPSYRTIALTNDSALSAQVVGIYFAAERIAQNARDLDRIKSWDIATDSYDDTSDLDDMREILNSCFCEYDEEDRLIHLNACGISGNYSYTDEMLTEVVYQADDFSMTETMEYNEDGRILSHKLEPDTGNDDNCEYATVWAYDQNGYCTDYEMNLSGNASSDYIRNIKTAYTYENGVPIEADCEITPASGDKRDVHYDIECAGSGKISKVSTETNGPDAFHFDADYDENGLMTETNFTNENIETKTAYEYTDGWRSRVNSSSTYENNSHLENIIGYDSCGRIVNITQNFTSPNSGTSKSEMAYAYDNKGRLTELSVKNRSNSDSESVTVTFSY